MIQSQKCFFFFYFLSEIAAFKTHTVSSYCIYQLVHPSICCFVRKSRGCLYGQQFQHKMVVVLGKVLAQANIRSVSLISQAKLVLRLALKTILSFHCLYREINLMNNAYP